MIFAERFCERVVIVGVKRSGIGSCFEEALGRRQIAARGGDHASKIIGVINIFSAADRAFEQRVGRFEIGMIVRVFAGMKKDTTESRILIFCRNKAFGGLFPFPQSLVADAT